jgi:hypothetical protein
MSTRYRGGLINKVPPATTGGKTGVASSVWNQTQQMQAVADGVWPLPKTVPGAPTIGTASVVDSSSATVTFTPPADDGGSPVTNYVIERYDVAVYSRRAALVYDKHSCLVNCIYLYVRHQGSCMSVCVCM